MLPSEAKKKKALTSTVPPGGTRSMPSLTIDVETKRNIWRLYAKPFRVNDLSPTQISDAPNQLPSSTVK